MRQHNIGGGYSLVNPKPQKNGFSKVIDRVEVIDLQSSVEISEGVLNGTHSKDEREEMVKMDISSKISRGLMDSGLVEIHKKENQMMNVSVYTGFLSVCRQPKGMVNIQDEKFVVNGNQFSNEELIEAVKYTFPERFI